MNRSNSPRSSLWSLFLDVDGTIADSFPGIQFSIREAFASRGKALPIEDLRSFIGPGIRNILKNLDPELPESELSIMEQAYRKSYDTRGCLKTTLYPGVHETLKQLSNENLQLFVITNKPWLATASIFEKFELTASFHEVLSRDSRNPSYRSKTEMLQDLIVRHKVDTSRAWMVGDTAEDWKAAREAHLAFIHAAYGYGSVDGVEVAEVHEFSQLLTLCSTGLAK